MERSEKMMKLKLIELMPLIQVHIDVLIFDFQPVHDAVLILIWKIKIIGGDACATMEFWGLKLLAYWLERPDRTAYVDFE